MAADVNEMITRLAFFDFDGTLFRSPQPAPGWEEMDWFTSIESISPPYVPETPSNDWWVGPVVSAMKMDLEDPSCFTVVITGREKCVFEDRVIDLLAAKEITPNILYLRDGGETRMFKKKCLGDLLRMLPQVQSVRGWEDKSDDLSEFKSFVESPKNSNLPNRKGVPFEAVYVPRQRSR